MDSFVSLYLLILGMTTTSVFCVLAIQEGARRNLAVHEAIRRQFSVSYFFLHVFGIMAAGVMAILVASFMSLLQPRDLEGWVGGAMNIAIVASLAMILAITNMSVHGVVSKINWAIEMDQLQKLSGVLMTSARSIDGAQSKMFSIYRDNYELQSFTVNDESVVKKLGMLVDQRVTVFYAAPSDRCLPVASFVALDTAKS